MTVTRGIKQLVADAMERIETLDPAAASVLLESGEAMVVDLRDIRELGREGRIVGSVHAPRGMLEFWVDPDSPYHKPILATEKKLVLHCASGWRSALAAQTLLDMGLGNVAHIGGGFKAWREAGLPTEELPPS